MKIFVVNQNGAERVVRLIIACLLIPAYFIIESSLYTLSLSIVGGIALYNSISGNCVIYRIFGVNTCKVKWGNMLIQYWKSL